MNYTKKLKLLMFLLLFLTLQLQAQAQIIDRVYARVGDDIITKFDVESLDPDKTKNIYAIKDRKERERVLGEYTKRTLDYLVDQHVIISAASREGVKVSDEEVQNAIKDIITQSGLSESEFIAVLAKENRTFPQYKWQIKMEILSSRVRSRVLSPKIVVTEEEINNYIKKNENDLKLSEQVELVMLSVPNKDALDKALADFKSSRSFEATVKKYTGDEKGGYLGWFEVNGLDNSIVSLFKTVAKGEISDVQVAGGSYRIFYIQNIKSKYSGTPEIRQEVAQKISEEKNKEIYEKWVKENKQRTFVQYMY